jgi:hypothetical protein
LIVENGLESLEEVLLVHGPEENAQADAQSDALGRVGGLVTGDWNDDLTNKFQKKKKMK